MSDEQSPFVIEATGIVKSFAGVQALRGIDFRVRRGEIHALLGQNGAGKSTLVKILNGVHTAGTYNGTVRVNGKVVQFNTPGDARLRGVAYVPQEIEVFEQLTVAENVFAGQTSLGNGLLVRQKRLQQRAAALFRDFGIPLNPSALVASLTAAQRHLVMIVRALATKPSVLMLDEPTASLSGAEVTLLFRPARPAARGRHHHDLHHPSPARGDRALRQRDGPARRPRRRGTRTRRLRQRQDHRGDVRPAPAAPLSEPPAAGRPSRRCSMSSTSPSRSTMASISASTTSASCCERARSSALPGCWVRAAPSC